MTLPNTFVVGCAKAGTTALCAYLRRHPAAYVPGLKETDWFAEDLGLAALRGLHDDRDYRALYAPANAEHRVRVDGSPSSLLSKVAAARIAATVPDARIIVMVRNPVEVIDALHTQTVVAGLQRIRKLEPALASARAATGAPANPAEIWTRYFDVVRLAPQIERYFDAFDRERIHLIRFEDLRQSPDTVWTTAQRFLGLPLEPLQPDVVNPNSEPVVASVQRIVFNPASRSRRLARRVLPPAARDVVRRSIYAANVRERPRPPMSRAARDMILDEIGADIEALGALLGWDVSGWMAAEPS